METRESGGNVSSNIQFWIQIFNETLIRFTFESASLCAYPRAQLNGIAIMQTYEILRLCAYDRVKSSMF